MEKNNAYDAKVVGIDVISGGDMFIQVLFRHNMVTTRFRGYALFNTITETPLRGSIVFTGTCLEFFDDNGDMRLELAVD